MEASKALTTSNYQELPLPEPEITTNKYLSLCESVASMLAIGCGVSGTAAKHGISRPTIDFWLKTSHFLALLEHKKEEYRKELLGSIKQAAKDSRSWQAAAWLLERSKQFGDEYHPPAVKQKVQVDITTRVFRHFEPRDVVDLIEET